MVLVFQLRWEVPGDEGDGDDDNDASSLVVSDRGEGDSPSKTNQVERRNVATVKESSNDGEDRNPVRTQISDSILSLRATGEDIH